MVIGWETLAANVVEVYLDIKLVIVVVTVVYDDDDDDIGGWDEGGMVKDDCVYAVLANALKRLEP